MDLEHTRDDSQTVGNEHGPSNTANPVTERYTVQSYHNMYY